MKIVYSESELFEFMNQAVEISPGHPVLIDKFLEDAIEVDVDAISDGETTIVAGIMEHIEEAGVHSGDSACVIPPFSLSDEIVDQIKLFTQALARELNVIGLMNVQYAVKEDTVYVLEVNPRASRTIPFVSKATGVPLARLAQVMVGRNYRKLAECEVESDILRLKSGFPFNHSTCVTQYLGSEMRSKGGSVFIDDG